MLNKGISAIIKPSQQGDLFAVYQSENWNWLPCHLHNQGIHWMSVGNPALICAIPLALSTHGAIKPEIKGSPKINLTPLHLCLHWWTLIFWYSMCGLMQRGGNGMKKLHLWRRTKLDQSFSFTLKISTHHAATVILCVRDYTAIWLSFPAHYASPALWKMDPVRTNLWFFWKIGTFD